MNADGPGFVGPPVVVEDAFVDFRKCAVYEFPPVRSVAVLLIEFVIFTFS